MKEKKVKVRILHLNVYDSQHHIFRRKNILPMSRIRYYVSQFMSFALRNPSKIFKVYITQEALILLDKKQVKEIYNMFEKCPGNIMVEFK